MPRRTNSLPRLCHHKRSGQACVYLNGQIVYLGKYGSAASKQRYDEVITDWLSNGRQLPEPTATVDQLCLAYLKHAKLFYVKNGEQTDEVHRVKAMVRMVSEGYGSTDATEFGPKKLKLLVNPVTMSKPVYGVVRSYRSELREIDDFTARPRHYGSHHPS